MLQRVTTRRHRTPKVESKESTMSIEEKSVADPPVDGERVVDRQLRQALESAKVEKIEAVGKPYDPEVHEAVLVHDSEEHPEETVTDEIEAGYTMHGRVVRPAKVRVAKKP